MTQWFWLWIVSYELGKKVTVFDFNSPVHTVLPMPKGNYDTGEAFYLPHCTKVLFFSEIIDVF